ncbi:MAG TPA: hypothetical protein VFZ00_29805, partial [Solirubrobacter sp.]|nr:hypothetical protein [Solirubrobacter sp.]
MGCVVSRAVRRGECDGEESPVGRASRRGAVGAARSVVLGSLPRGRRRSTLAGAAAGDEAVIAALVLTVGA